MAPIATTTATDAATTGVASLKLTSDPAPTPRHPTVWFSQSGLPESEYKYKHFLPSSNKKAPETALTEFTHVDPGHQALTDPTPRSFLDGADIEDLSPLFGSVVDGSVQLSKLDARGRQQLALYVAQRGVVAFRDQDFIDQPQEWLINDWAKFFGRPHVHPTTVRPDNWPEFHLVYRARGSNQNHATSDRATTTGWHSDVSYEAQPPGLTALFLLDSPPSGGDTGYTDQRATYNALTPSFREYLETLSVVHSGFAQADTTRTGAAGGGEVGRQPVENIHPLIRRHPVTGEKALYVNRVFSRRIVGLKREESDALLEFLYRHIEGGLERQVRVRWGKAPGTVVLWDNRTTTHSAVIDFDNTPARRHGARITPQAERPTL